MPAPLLVSAYVLSAVAAALFIHPYLTYPLTLRLMRTRRVDSPATPSEAPETTGREFSLLFCAFNEIAIMSVKLENLRALKGTWPDLEILAYDDASTDGTWEALRDEPDLLRAVRGGGRTGKAHGMKVLASQAAGDFLIFTDANVSVDPKALRAFADEYRDEAVGGVCGTLRYSSDGGSSTEVVGGLYWRLEESIKDLESRTGNVMGADGSIFSVRRASYPDFPDSVQDDFTVSMNVIFGGRRLTRRHDALAYEQLVSSSREEFRRKVRIAARAYHTHMHLRPGLKRMTSVDRYKYASHKILRWHSATWLALAVVALAVGVAGQLGLAALGVSIAVVAISVGAAALLAPHLFAHGREILLALVATNWGVWQAKRGKTFVTWQPPPR